MAVPTSTVGELLSRLSFIVEGQETQSTALRSSYVYALQMAQDELVRERPLVDRLRVESSFNTINGQKDYLLPDDVHRVIVRSVYHLNGTSTRLMEFFELSDAESGRYQHLLDTTTGQPYRFTLLGIDSTGNAEMRLYPTPDGVYTIKYRYYGFPSRFEADTNGSTVLDKRIPKIYHLALVSGALVNFFPNRLTPQELQAHMAVWEKAKREWRQSDRLTTTDVFTIEPRGNYRQGRSSRQADRYPPGSGPSPGWG